MATTDITITVQTSTNTFAFPFPYLKTEDVRVELQEFDTTVGVDEPLISTSESTNFIIPPANPTTIEFSALGAATIYQNADGTVKVTSDNGYQVRVRIYRNTPADATPATFFAGSAVRAKDLNDNFEKILYIMQERQNFLSNIIAGQFPTGGINTSALVDDAVTASKLRDDPTIDSNRSVTTNHIRDNAVTMDKLASGPLPTNVTITTNNISDGTIVNNDISASAAIAQSKLNLSITDSEVNASAAIAGTKVSPDFGSQNITTTGNATITGTATLSGLIYPTSDGASDEVLKTNGSGTLSFGTILTVPAGAVFYLATSTAPTGYLKANGAAVSRTTYADLFAAVGTTYGSGDGSTTFNLPDLRGEFLRGWDDGRDVDEDRVFGSFQDFQLAEHNHGLTNGTNQVKYTGAASGFPNLGPGSPESYKLSFSTISVNNQGGASNNGESRPRNIALLACIKY